MRKNPLEQAIKLTIMEWLSYQRECFFWQHNQFPMWNAQSRSFRRLPKYTPKGIADIIGIWKGKFLAIEVKSAKGVVSPEQRDFLFNVTKQGGIAFVARSLDDVIRELSLFS